MKIPAADLEDPAGQGCRVEREQVRIVKNGILQTLRNILQAVPLELTQEKVDFLQGEKSLPFVLKNRHFGVSLGFSPCKAPAPWHC